MVKKKAAIENKVDISRSPTSKKKMKKQEGEVAMEVKEKNIPPTYTPPMPFPQRL